MGIEALPVDRRLIYGLLSGVVILALVQSEDSGQIQIKSRWIPLLGDSSYVLYLIHYPLISVLCKVFVFLGLAGVVGATIAYPLIICACILTSVAFHLLLEKPMLHALSKRKPAATLVHAAP